LHPGQLQERWAHLADADAARAYRAVWSLAAAPAQAVPLLRDRLGPVPHLDSQLLARMVGDLDSDRFAVRERAMRGLEQQGELAELALRETLAQQPSLEVRRRCDLLLWMLESTPPPPHPLPHTP